MYTFGRSLFCILCRSCLTIFARVYHFLLRGTCNNGSENNNNSPIMFGFIFTNGSDFIPMTWYRFVLFLTFQWKRSEKNSLAKHISSARKCHQHFVWNDVHLKSEHRLPKARAIQETQSRSHTHTHKHFSQSFPYWFEFPVSFGCIPSIVIAYFVHMVFWYVWQTCEKIPNCPYSFQLNEISQRHNFHEATDDSSENSTCVWWGEIQYKHEQLHSKCIHYSECHYQEWGSEKMSAISHIQPWGCAFAQRIPFSLCICECRFNSDFVSSMKRFHINI